MCGGATERGSVKTSVATNNSAAGANPIEIAIQAKTVKGTKMQARYGSHKMALTTTTAVACTKGCTVNMSVPAGHRKLPTKSRSACRG